MFHQHYHQRPHHHQQRRPCTHQPHHLRILDHLISSAVENLMVPTRRVTVLQTITNVLTV